MAVPLTQFILRRFFQALPLLLLISIGVFALIHFVPGGPLTVFLANPQVRPKTSNACNDRLDSIARYRAIRALAPEFPAW